jgi:hypothetical protein
MTPKTAILRLLLFWLLYCSASLSAAGDSSTEEEAACGASDINEYRTPPPKSCRLLLSPRPSSSSSSSQDTDDDTRKYGIYSAVTIPKNHPLTPLGGDLVLHLIDVRTSSSSCDEHKTCDNGNTEQQTSSQLQKWKKYGYIQEAATSGHGGNYEGLGDIWTVLPGVSMLGASPSASSDNGDESSGESTTESSTIEVTGDSTGRQGGKRPNIWASIPENDEASHPRYQSPLAGSFALHYNLTHQVTIPGGLEAGDEVLVDRSGWHRNRALTLDKAASTVNDGNNDITAMSVEHLFNHGTCLDNIYPGTSTHGYGRGALASRVIPSGSIVAPVPVLPLPREELKYLRMKEWKKVTSFRKRLLKENANREEDDDVADVTEEELPLPPDVEWRQQLMLNYCYGHEQSSVLLFPYGVFVNYINHAPSTSESSDGPVANVKLQWSERLMNTTTSTNSDLRSLTPSRLWEQSTTPEGLVLELVALKDIQPDEEILLDYGSIWSKAWKEHSDQYPDSILKLADDHTLEKEYSPAYIMDDVVTNLRTAEEQVQFPYPENVFTACFYRYDNETTTKNNDTVNKDKTKATPWKMSLGLFDMTNLRPCKVISREPANDRFATPQQLQQQGQPPQGKMLYTAIIQNRPGLPANERIPKGTKHVVSGIPRGAFRFVDRPYTNDIHLDGAFRHNIGAEEAGIYPEVWLDLKPDE